VREIGDPSGQRLDNFVGVRDEKNGQWRQAALSDAAPAQSGALAAQRKFKLKLLGHTDVVSRRKTGAD
jgi:hypothetical protein